MSYLFQIELSTHFYDLKIDSGKIIPVDYIYIILVENGNAKIVAKNFTDKINYKSWIEGFCKAWRSIQPDKPLYFATLEYGIPYFQTAQDEVLNYIQDKYPILALQATLIN